MRVVYFLPPLKCEIIVSKCKIKYYWWAFSCLDKGPGGQFNQNNVLTGMVVLQVKSNCLQNYGISLYYNIRCLLRVYRWCLTG